VILVDAGPLVAVSDPSDTHHAACVNVVRALREPAASVWPAVTEALYLLRRWPATQDAILGMIEAGTLRVLPFGPSDVPRVRALMAKYRDLPMDFADAVLVRAAERERIRTIFTVDRRDFGLYRPLGMARFRIVP
jgi:predicted nucleic acid-binding protein